LRKNIISGHRKTDTASFSAASAKHPVLGSNNLPLKSTPQRDVQVLFLSDGIAWHSDDRRNSVAAAVEVALQHQLQGVVLESGALRQQQGAAAAARRQGLQVLDLFDLGLVTVSFA